MRLEMQVRRLCDVVIAKDLCVKAIVRSDCRGPCFLASLLPCFLAFLPSGAGWLLLCLTRVIANEG
jgi:hypothetical protein